MKHVFLKLTIIYLLTPVSGIGQETTNQSEFYILERLPEWFIEQSSLTGIDFRENYIIDNRLNPLYLEADFNGDGTLDIAISIRQKTSGKFGFAIVHGESNEVFIIGAGTKVSNGLSDDMTYIDIWDINRKKINEAGLNEETGTGERGELILSNPSLQIEKSGLGGGQIYWNGNQYAYFHQTC